MAHHKYEVNSSTHAEAPPDATILECTAPITPTTTTTSPKVQTLFVFLFPLPLCDTCLTMAEHYGHPETVRSLVDLQKVDVNQTDRLGNTALEAAPEQGTAMKEEVKALQEMMKSVMDQQKEMLEALKGVLGPTQHTAPVSEQAQQGGMAELRAECAEMRETVRQCSEHNTKLAEESMRLAEEMASLKKSHHKDEVNSSTHAKAPPDATILECTAPITPTTTTTTLPADPFYQGPNHYPDNAYRLLSHGVSYPVYAVGTKWEDYPSEAEQVATIESGTVCVLEAVFGDVDNEDAAAVLQIVEVLRAPEEGEEEEELYDAESLEDMTARLKGKIVMKAIGANGFLHANSCPLLGTWQYRCCDGPYRSYKILATSRGEVQFVEEMSITLKHYSPHQSVPGVASVFIAQWGGGHSSERDKSIYFHMNTDGKLESLFVSSRYSSGFRAVATRIALATVVPEEGTM